MKTYDPNRYSISWAGIKLNEGLAEGTFVTVSPMAPGFSSKVSVDGPVTRVRSHDRRRTVRLVLMQTSAVNERLSAAYNADRNRTNGGGPGMFRIADMDGTTEIEDPKAYIAQDPDLVLSATAETREWLFELPGATATHGTINDD